MPTGKGRRGTGFALAVFLVLSGQSPALAAPTMPAIKVSPANFVPACVTPQRLMRFLHRRNSHVANKHRQIAQLYAREGKALGVRWDFAFFQMIVETASLSYRRTDGTAGDVKIEQNNFAGLGATGNGETGETFATVRAGVRAHLEHLLLYAGEKVANPVAERTRKVQIWRVLEAWQQGFDRPITFDDLAKRWAPQSAAYGPTIQAVADRFFRQSCNGQPYTVAAVSQEIVPPEPTPAIEAGWLFRVPRSVVLPPRRHTDMIAPTDITRRRLALGVGPPRTKRRRPPVTRAKAPRQSAAHLKQGKAKRSKTRSLKREAAVQRPPDRNERIRTIVSGKLVHIRSSVGATIPVTFYKNGRMRGEAGYLSFILGAATDRGKWWVQDGKLCQRWRVWLRAKTRCITVQKRGRTLYWRSADGRSGTAQIVSR